MGELRSCVVSYQDQNFLYSVEITAEPLYEAAMLGIQAMSVPPTQLSMTKFEVAVKSPEVSHAISGAALVDWLQCSGKSPREQALKARLKELLKR